MWKIMRVGPFGGPSKLGGRLPFLTAKLAPRTVNRSLSISPFLLSQNSSKFGDIAALVPQTGEITLVDGKELTRGVLLRDLKIPKGKSLKVVSVNNTGEEGDPTVTVKVVDAAAESQAADRKAKKPKPPKVKELSVSWSISKKDLDVQKRKAIESIFSRGHSLQLSLEDKGYRRQPLTENQIESREQLVKRVCDMVEKLGTQAKQPVGTVNGRMMFFYRPISPPE